MCFAVFLKTKCWYSYLTLAMMLHALSWISQQRDEGAGTLYWRVPALKALVAGITNTNGRLTVLTRVSLTKQRVHQVQKINQAYSEYKHVLANILHSLFVARTPSEEAHSPGCRSNVENAPIDGQSPASQPRPLPIYGAQFWERPRHPPVTGQQRAQTAPAVRTMSSYRGMDASL